MDGRQKAGLSSSEVRVGKDGFNHIYHFTLPNLNMYIVNVTLGD